MFFTRYMKGEVPPCIPITARVSGALFNSNKRMEGKQSYSEAHSFSKLVVKIMKQPFCSA